MGKAVFAIIFGVISVVTVDPVFARSYDVEIIIFEPEPEPEIDAGSDISGEIWNFSPSHISRKLKHMEKLSVRSVDYETRPILDRLETVRKNLEAAGYRVLKTAKWNQPPLVYRKAPLVSLGNIYTALPHSYVRVYKTSLLFADIDIQLSPHVTPELDSFADYIPGPGQKRLPLLSQSYSPHYFLSEKRA